MENQPTIISTLPPSLAEEQPPPPGGVGGSITEREINYPAASNLKPQTSNLVTYLSVAATIACGVELLFQRGLSRMGTSLTIGGADQWVLDLFTMVNRITGYSLNMAIVLCWLAIALGLANSWRSTLTANGASRWLRLAATIGLTAGLVYTPLLFLTTHSGDVVYQTVMYLTLLLLVGVGIAQSPDWRGRVMFGLIAFAYLAQAYYVMTNNLYPGAELHAADVYAVGQLFVMLNGLLIFACYALTQPFSRAALISSGAAMLTLSGLFLAPMKVDVPAYIVIFSSGYQFTLPWPFYVVVLGALVYTLVQALTGPTRGWAGSTPFGLGLLLIAIAGYDLKLDLQFLQAALGLLLFTGMATSRPKAALFSC